jgi:hypothetical protein
MEAIIARVSRAGAEKLALRFSAGALKGSGSALAAAMGEEGFLVRPGSGLETWKFEGLEREGEGALFFGPDFEGASLDDIEGLGDGMSALFAFAQAFETLASEGKLPRGIISSGLLVSGAKGGGGAGAVLVLPPTAVEKALASRGSAARSAAIARLASPLAKGPRADASFLLAQAAYSFATGSGAFEREASDSGSLAAAKRYATSAALAAPRLDPALAALIDAALDDPNRVGLDAWIKALAAADASGWERELSPEEEARIALRRASVEAAAKKKRQRETFFRRRGALLVGVGVALAALGFAAADIIRAQRAKPDYSKLPPLEVVRHYYAAIDGLDIDSLEACGERAAIKADGDALANLVVLTRTRMAYEGKNPLLRANDWVAGGKGAIKDGEFLYGIVGLDISELGDNGADSGSVRYRAKYSVWSLERTDAPSGDPLQARTEPVEEKRVDELALTHGKKGWKISSLERTRNP